MTDNHDHEHDAGAAADQEYRNDLNEDDLAAEQEWQDAINNARSLAIRLVTKGKGDDRIKGAHLIAHLNATAAVDYHGERLFHILGHIHKDLYDLVTVVSGEVPVSDEDEAQE